MRPIFTHRLIIRDSVGQLRDVRESFYRPIHAWFCHEVPKGCTAIVEHIATRRILHSRKTS